jgi:hypothetical protein
MLTEANWFWFLGARLQKRVATVMKKAGWKGQVMIVVFLIVLLLILTFLVFSG